MLFIGGVVSIFYRVELFCVPLILYFSYSLLHIFSVDLLIGLSLSIRDKKGERDLDENLWESCLFCLRGVEIVFLKGRVSLLLFFYILFHIIVYMSLFPHMRWCVCWVFQERQVHFDQDLLPLIGNFLVRSLRLGFVMYLGILLYMGIMLYVCFVTDWQRGRLLGFEFVMLANHDKTWQKLSLISLEWSTLKPKTKKLKFGIKTNELQAGWFDRSKDRFDLSKITYQQNQQT